MLYQLSYEATHWERGQFIEFLSPMRSEMTWGIYEIIHICTAVVYKSEEWSSQWIFQFKQLERRSLKKKKKNQGFSGIRTHDLRDTGAKLYQLSFEATRWERGQFIEFISPMRSEMTWGIYEIIHICTAVKIRKFTAMITLHFHILPQCKYELFHIYLPSFHSSREM